MRGISREGSELSLDHQPQMQMAGVVDEDEGERRTDAGWLMCWVNRKTFDACTCSVMVIKQMPLEETWVLSM